jgi:hypothetical protein
MRETNSNSNVAQICDLLAQTCQGLVPPWYARRQLHNQVYLTRKLFTGQQKLEFERFAASAEEFVHTVEDQQKSFEVDVKALNKILKEILKSASFEVNVPSSFMDNLTTSLSEPVHT